LTNGGYRNHCPFCLYSQHVDILPGDRRSVCGGVMEPSELRRGGKGWQIVHRCQRCGEHRANVIASAGVQPDCGEAIAQLLLRTNLASGCRR
jgi:hypothetical protein